MDGVRNRGLNGEPIVVEGVLDPRAIEAPRIDVSGVLENVRVFVREVGAPFVVTRTVLVAAAAIAVGGLPLSPWIPAYWYRATIAPTVDAFARWDGWHYLNIARSGYLPKGADEAAFFPLYPMLMRAFGLATGNLSLANLEIWGLLISNACLLIAAGLLYALVRLDAGRELASRSVWYLLIFPTSFFLSAVYAESLFLVMAIGAIYAARRERWLFAGLLGAGAALTRPFGVVVAVPLAVELLMQWRAAGRPRWLAFPAIALIPAALGCYMVFLQREYGDPLKFLHVQGGWNRHLMFPWDTFGTFFSKPLTLNSGQHAMIDLGFAILAIVSVVLAWRLLRASYAAFLTVLVLIPLSSGSLTSLGRFDLVFFPVVLVLAKLGARPGFDRAYTVAALGMGAVFMALFAQWYWVA
jgi:Gpi18-like mannosyltransferase